MGLVKNNGLYDFKAIVIVLTLFVCFEALAVTSPHQAQADQRDVIGGERVERAE